MMKKIICLSTVTRVPDWIMSFTEFFIVSAVYYYYLQQRTEAMASLNEIELNEDLATDTNQILYFHYIKGSAGLCEGKTPDERKLEEFDELYTTWKMASEQDICILKEMVCKDSPI